MAKPEGSAWVSWSGRVVCAHSEIGLPLVLSKSMYLIVENWLINFMKVAVMRSFS